MLYWSLGCGGGRGGVRNWVGCGAFTAESARWYVAFVSATHVHIWLCENRTPRNQRPNVNVFNRVRDPPDPPP